MTSEPNLRYRAEGCVVLKRRQRFPCAEPDFQPFMDFSTPEAAAEYADNMNERIRKNTLLYLRSKAVIPIR